MRTALFVAVMLMCAAGFADNLVPNPSAEDGAEAPRSWRAVPASSGFWQEGGAKFGKRCLGLDATEGPAAWRSKSAQASAVQGYRLSGWIRSEGGTGWIEAHFVSVRARRVQTLRTPAASDRSWVYVALDIPAEMGAPASVHAECRAAKGRCLFDGIRLTALDNNILPNPDLAPREVEAKPDPSGAPVGWHALPENDLRTVAVTDVGPEKTRALMLGGDNPKSVASYIVDLPAETKACRLCVRAMSPGKAACVISWFGPRGWIADEPLILNRPGERLEEPSLTGQAPPGANRARAVFALAEGESAVVVPVSLAARTARERPRCQVFVNQVGYEPDGKKAAIVATSHFPARLEDARFAMVDESGRAVLQDRLVSVGRVHEGQPDDWGSYYWLADLSKVSQAGRFRVKVRVGTQSAASYPFSIRRGVLFQETAELAYRFLYYQRCGCAVPGWHDACHLDDARLPDGTHADLTGGWHDAGDYNKWMYPHGPPLVLYGLASAYLAHRKFFDAIDRDENGRADLLDEILWGADWMMRMRNPKTGGLLGSVSTGWGFWGLAERETDNIAGNEDDRPVRNIEGHEEPSAALAAAALAKIAKCVADGEDFTRAAVGLEEYARKKEGRNADRLLASLAVWQATGRGEHLDEARACADEIAGLQPDARDGRALAALALFLTNVPETNDRERYRQALRASMDRFSRNLAQPFPMASAAPGQKDMEEQPRLGAWGGNMSITSLAWAALACSSAFDLPEAREIGLRQLDWLFGLNPLDVCMLEGVGSYNPPQYHHRYFDYPEHRDGAVPGAIPNGIGRPERNPSLDIPFFDWVHRDAMTTEPWIPYTGYYLLALASMDAGM